jgi:ABC-2 type transport system ATP-binding protein
MYQGRLIAEGSPADMKARSARRSGSLLAIRAADTHTAYRLLRRERPHAVLYGGEVRLRTFDPDGDHLALAAILEREGMRGVRIEPVAMSMDEAFIDFIRHAEAAHA